MPQLLYTIEEYTSQIRKKDTNWIVFNKVYNDVHAFHKKLDDDTRFKYLSQDETDYDAQKEFLEFMENELPHVKLTKVFDLVSSGYITYPYLGSYALDIEEGTEEYNKLIEKYENKDGTAKGNNAVIWVIDLETAQQFHEKRKQVIDSEFD